MKKLIVFLLVVCLTEMASAAYYVAGNGAAGNPWCGGLSWNPSGSQMTTADGRSSITYAGVPAGDYRFKITNGTWSTNYGFSALLADSCNLYCTGDGDGNVCFTTTAPQDITVVLTSGKKVIVNGTVGNDRPDPSQFGLVGVPSEYEGVMLQAFYWDSYRLTKYSNTKWKTLVDNGYATDMAQTFDLVWLPPCGYGGGVGYYTKTYSNLDSDWGSKAYLMRLIDTLHTYNCKAIADVVINHRQSSGGWAKSFTKETFGTYGTFQMTSEHICSGDEAFTDASSDSKTLAHGAADTGDNDSGCRDLDHTSAFVQDFCTAYCNWLLNTVGFDGFRYDMVKGYGGRFVSQYNLASQPFFSVGEYWDGASAIKSWLEAAQYNSAAFDFATKTKINTWKGGSAYSNLKNAGLRGLGLSKYAVTFIDNHDTFERSDNQGSEFLGYNSVLANKRQQILQANAYILMLPGTPCVSWPHWYTFTEDIRSMVQLRKAAGIHSESEVTEETAAANSYSATVVGHRGNVILRMGTARDTTMPAGYKLAISGPEMEIYVSENVNYGSALEDVTSENTSSVSKQIVNGRLLIRKNGKTYDATGRVVE